MAVLSQAVGCMVGHPWLSHVEVEGVLVLFKLPGCFQTCWNLSWKEHARLFRNQFDASFPKPTTEVNKTPLIFCFLDEKPHLLNCSLFSRMKPL